MSTKLRTTYRSNSNKTHEIFPLQPFQSYRARLQMFIVFMLGRSEAIKRHLSCQIMDVHKISYTNDFGGIETTKMPFSLSTVSNFNGESERISGKHRQPQARHSAPPSKLLPSRVEEPFQPRPGGNDFKGGHGQSLLAVRSIRHENIC